MAPRKLRSKSPEFPILDANGLYAAEIRGDGNCLFNALSDQLFGHQERHEALRTTTIEHMRSNADFYRQYMAVNTVRRNPKRKTTSALPAHLDTASYSEDELQKQFEAHIEKMGQPGEWADNMEVSAFASAMNVHVCLWQADFAYLISPRVYLHSAHPDDRQTLNIAYHAWEHYSSVRNLAGPHCGLPGVHFNLQMLSKKRPSPSVDGDDDESIPRARKRRSPLPLFDSDSTPEGTESSSDESNGPVLSQQGRDLHEQVPPVKPQKLTIKLRGLRTTDPREPFEPIKTAPTTPITAEPAATKTVMAELAAAEPVAAKPDIAAPVTASPETAQPAIVQPDMTPTTTTTPEPTIKSTTTTAMTT